MTVTAPPLGRPRSRHMEEEGVPSTWVGESETEDALEDIGSACLRLLSWTMVMCMRAFDEQLSNCNHKPEGPKDICPMLVA